MAQEAEDEELEGKGGLWGESGEWPGRKIQMRDWESDEENRTIIVS